jgi:Raf kinase inhibitor-like YbhB/YbcL family protein
MKNRYAFISIVGLAAASLSACGGDSCPEHCAHHSGGESTSGGERPMLAAEVEVPETITVTLDGLSGELDNRHVFNGFGCTGENHSPAISWSGLPEGTQSVVLEVHDPDAPTGVGFFHWIVADLPTTTTSLAFDAAATGLPAGVVQTRTDFGGNTFGGPCPPPGAPHRYIFTVYAIDAATLGVDANTAPAVVRFMLRMHTLAVGRAVATFGFPQQ